MFRLPDSVTWPMVLTAAVVVLAGLWTGGEVRERISLLDSLERDAKSYPVDADVARTLIACNKRIVVDVEQCGAKLIELFGTGVVDRLANMQERGAFGM